MTEPQKEERRSGSVTDAQCGVSDNGQTVIYGPDGRCSIKFTDPAPAPVKPGTVVDLTKPPQRLLRWKTNGRRKSAGFIAPEMLAGLELWSWRALFVAAAVIHFLRIH